MGIRSIAICVTLFLLGGCASVFSVKSDPVQSDVYLVDSASGEKKLLGKTPLELPTSDLRKTAGEQAISGEFFTVLVEKDGYVSQKLLVPASRFGTLVTALDVRLKQGNTFKEEGMAKEILDHLFLAQRFALSGQYERAQIEIDKILAQVPEFPRALSMRGSIYFAQKNYNESLKWYDAALKADPQMEDTVQMAAKARAIQRGERPAAKTLNRQRASRRGTQP